MRKKSLFSFLFNDVSSCGVILSLTEWAEVLAGEKKREIEKRGEKVNKIAEMI